MLVSSSEIHGNDEIVLMKNGFHTDFKLKGFFFKQEQLEDEFLRTNHVKFNQIKQRIIDSVCYSILGESPKFFARNVALYGAN